MVYNMDSNIKCAKYILEGFTINDASYDQNVKIESQSGKYGAFFDIIIRS